MRITKPGRTPIETTVAESHLTRVPSSDRAHAFLTSDPVPADYDGGVVEAELRHAVNVNTVPREILVELLTGLVARISDDHLTFYNRDEAEAFAKLLQKPPALRTMEELLGRLQELIDRALEANLKGQISYERYNATCAWTRMVKANAVDPGAAFLLGTGTMPLTTLSDDTVTIEALAAVTAPSGVTVGERHLREVVRLGAPTRVERRWECQYDFQRYLGYPFGNSSRVAAVNSSGSRGSDLTLRPRQTPDREAWVQLAVSKDCRGMGALLDHRYRFDPGEHDPPPSFVEIPEEDRREWTLACGAYRHSYEGVEVPGGTLKAGWKRLFSPMPGLPDAAAGGVEFWIRFRQVPQRIQLLDIREGDFANRMSLHYENGVLFLSASDAAVGAKDDPIGNGLALVRHPFAPQPDTWYHIGAYWEGTRYARLALLVDGFSHPGAKFVHVNEEGKEILTELASAVGAGDASVPLLDDSFLPDGPTPIRIGGEVILYDRTTGVHLRAARGTAPAGHPKGAKVQVFGYSSRVRRAVLTPSEAGLPALSYDRIGTGGGAVRYPFGAIAETAVVKDDGLGASETTIPVATVAPFPARGYLTIGQEAIYYDGIRTTPPAFTGCARGQHGTRAAAHEAASAVRLWSIAGDTYGTPASDDRYPTPTVLQIDSEWFGPVRKDPARVGFWIGVQSGAAPIPLFRGVLGTSPQAHAAGAPVIPTWVARDSAPEVARQNCGAGDRVTLIGADGSKARMRIRHAADVSGGFLRASIGAGAQLVAFDANVPAVHPADDLRVRILKFPSGELLDLSWLERAAPDVTLGPFVATVDEVKFLATPKRTRSMGVPVGDSYGIDSTEGMTDGGGAVKVGDEIIGYARASEGGLRSIRRGYLGSAAGEHDAGDEAFHLSLLPVSALESGIGPAAGEVSLRRPLPTWMAQPQDLYVLIDEEVLLFEKWPGTRDEIGKPAMRLRMPLAHDGSRGLFRGRFGTSPQSHAQDALAYAIPWRYHDTYAAGEFDNRMAYWQVSTTVPDARWGRLSWEARVPGDDPLVRLHVLVRVDGRGEFTDPPDGEHLFDFIDPEAPNRIDRTGGTHDAGQLDVRFAVEYRPGSFRPNDAWKKTPRLFQVGVEYERPTRALHHEER
ncbi:MAG: hypothetical protein HYY17_12640 [Planctomycetes bacterium]|nr:hypothetical protein [Planctomycetota bacterium]